MAKHVNFYTSTLNSNDTVQGSSNAEPGSIVIAKTSGSNPVARLYITDPTSTTSNLFEVGSNNSTSTVTGNVNLASKDSYGDHKIVSIGANGGIATFSSTTGDDGGIRLKKPTHIINSLNIRTSDNQSGVASFTSDKITFRQPVDINITSGSTTKKVAEFRKSSTTFRNDSSIVLDAPTIVVNGDISSDKLISLSSKSDQDISGIKLGDGASLFIHGIQNTAHPLLSAKSGEGTVYIGNFSSNTDSANLLVSGQIKVGGGNDPVATLTRDSGNTSGIQLKQSVNITKGNTGIASFTTSGIQLKTNSEVQGSLKIGNSTTANAIAEFNSSAITLNQDVTIANKNLTVGGDFHANGFDIVNHLGTNIITSTGTIDIEDQVVFENTSFINMPHGLKTHATVYSSNGQRPSSIVGVSASGVYICLVTTTNTGGTTRRYTGTLTLASDQEMTFTAIGDKIIIGTNYDSESYYNIEATTSDGQITRMEIYPLYIPCDTLGQELYWA